MSKSMDYLIEDFILYCMQKNLSVKTYSSYEQSLKLFELFLKEEHQVTDVDKIKREHIRDYITYLQERGKYTVQIRHENVNKPENRTDRKKQISVSTINNYMRNIKVFFNYLVDEKVIRENPMNKIPFLKKGKKVKEPLTDREVRKLLRAFDTTTTHGYRDYVITKFLLMTGARITETLELENNDVNFTDNSVKFRYTKNRNEKVSFLTNKIAFELRRWMAYKERYVNSDYLFPTIRGTVLNGNNFAKNLRKVCEDAGLDEVNPHRLRHTFACMFLKQGGSIYVLSKLLDHSSVQTTEVYLGLSRDDIRKEYLKFQPLRDFNF